MPKPILYYHPYSPPSRAVLLVAKEIGLELDERIIDLIALEHLSEEYKKKNPQSTVPTLDDNGDVIYDSHAINAYIIGKYAKDDKLYPKDLLKRARIDQRLHADSAFFLRGFDIIKSVLFLGATEISEEKKEALHRGLDLIEIFLESGTYLVGDSLTLADLSCCPIIESCKGMVQFGSDNYPRIAAWTERLAKELPYYDEINVKNAKKHVQLFYAFLEKNKSASKL